MLSNDLVEKLKERYAHVHPLIFQRSKERAKDENDLFEILEDFPNKYPVVWDEQTRRWVTTEDITLRKNFIRK